jgi:hypothetical protein
MAGLGREPLTIWTSTKTLVFAIGVGIALVLGAATTSHAADKCSNETPGTWLPEVPTSPDAADRQAIMDLIHSFLWSLDERDVAKLDNFEALFAADASYETCRGGGAVLIRFVARAALRGYIEAQFKDLAAKGLQTRHIEGNTLLHSKDANTVDGKSTMLVSIQRAQSAAIPEFDYSAVLLWTFVKVDDIWKIAKLIIITDTPDVEERAR